MKSLWVKRLTALGVALALASCSSGGSCKGCNVGGNGGGGNGNYNLVVDDTSPVPLININTQQFYVYMTNVGTGNATDLSWNIATNASSNASSKGLWGKLKNTLGLSSKPSPKVIGEEIKILDATNCVNVSAGNSCRMLLQANDPGSVVLQSSSKTSTSTITQNVVSAYSYTPVYTGPSGTLTLSPLSSVNYGSGFAGYTFFIINNGTSAISLDQAPFGSLPSGIDYSLIAGQSCPNPLPGQSVCQVRMTMTMPKGSVGTTTSVNLTPTGTVVGGDVLPTQGTNILAVSSEKLGNVGTSTPVLNVDANSTAISTAFAYISNTGSGQLSIGSLVSGNSLATISSDECSGQTLAPGAVCRYQLNIDPNQINSSGSAIITIPYNDGKTSASTSTGVHWTYTSIVTPAPSSTLTVGGNLSQNNLTTTLTIKNTGNVLFRNLSAPVLSPSNPHLTILNATCAATLAPNASCTYNLSYTPAAPSENSSVTISGITASYVDSSGVSQNVTLPSTTSVNLSSTFAGFLATGGDFNLDSTTPTKTVAITNNGNIAATLTNIAVSGDNLASTGGTCVAGDIAPAATCTIIVSLVNTAAAASGNGNLTLTYDNHNGTAAATSTSNISWVIGAVPSLSVTFAQSNLATIVGFESSTQVTLTNNGNSILSNIVLPTPPSGFTWAVSETSPSCTLSGQTLNMAATCNLKLTYAPTVSSAGAIVTIGKFSATSSGSNYTSSNDYTVTATAVSQNILSFNPPSVSQSANWVTNTPTNQVVITNTDSSAITVTNIVVSGGMPVTASGCTGALSSGASCTLTLTGTYSSSGSSNITFSYTTPVGAKSQSLPVSIIYQAQPVITPSLVVSPSPIGTITTYNNGTPTTTPVSLTNNTTVQNSMSATDGTLKIKQSSLYPSANNSVTYSYSVQGISNNPCPAADANGYISLPNTSGSNVCNFNIITAGSAGSSLVATTTGVNTVYQVQAYTSSSVTPAYLADTNGPQVSTITNVVQAVATLSAPVLTDASQSSAFIGVEQGLSKGPISFTVQNVGAEAVQGAVTAPTIAGFSFNMSGCNNLAVNASCTFSATLNSPTVIASANLNSANLTYTTATGAATVALPSMQYSVIAPGTPAISVNSITMSNCQAWSGAVNNSICLINTGNAAPSVVITLKNTGSGTANGFSISNIAALQTALGSGYNQVVANTCSGNLASLATCTLTISPISSTASSTTTGYDISSTSLNYSYTYGTNNQLSVSASTAAISVDATIASPVLTIGTIANVPATGTESALVTLSNWYGGSLPAAPTFTITPSGSNVTTSTCSWTGATNGATCTTNLTTTGTTTAGAYSLTASVPGFTAAVRNFVISPQLYLNIYVTATTVDTSVNQSGAKTAQGAITNADNYCNIDSNKPAANVSIGSRTYKALMWSNGVRTLSISGWPIQPSTKYQTTQNGASPLLLGTSDANGVLYELAAQINPTGYGFLAGMEVNTTTKTWSGAVNCSNWTDTTQAAQTNGAMYGYTGNWYQPPYWVQSARDYCHADKVLNLLCVEQP